MFFLGHGGYSPGQLGGGNRSPVSSPTPQGTPALSTPSHMVGGYPGGGLGPGTNSHNTSGTIVYLLSIKCLYSSYSVSYKNRQLSYKLFFSYYWRNFKGLFIYCL